MKNLKNKKGFTLVELIVVIVILGILMAIAIPNVVAYIDKANTKADGLAVRNVYLAAVTALAEKYGEDPAPAEAYNQEAIQAEVIDLAGLTDLTGYTINISGNEVTSVELDSDNAACGQTVTYNPTATPTISFTPTN